MAVPVIMPRQGQSVESCIIAKWYKQTGVPVKIGDLLFTYETDKAAFDEEAKVEGVLLAIFFAEGDDVPVLTNVCVIGNAGESFAEFDPKIATATVSAEMDASKKYLPNSTRESATEMEERHSPTLAVHDDTEIKISPRAKSLAAKSGIDYRYANATGPGGRIIERDLAVLYETGPKYTLAVKDAYLQSMDTNHVNNCPSGTGLGGRITTGDFTANQETSRQTPTGGLSSGPFKEAKIPNIRKTIARAMLNSLATTAQLTLNSSFDASDILAFRKKVKETGAKDGRENITLNDMILYAVSRTLLNHHELNAHFLEDRALYFENAHLGVAVDTERGLMVPTIFNANLKTLAEISAEMKTLAGECQKGSINPDYLKGAGFTITNLGTLGVESFTPVLNPPQTGILGVSCIIQRVKEVDGQYLYYPAMGLSLTFDHRALDGAPAARFLQELRNYMENFSANVSK